MIMTEKKAAGIRCCGPEGCGTYVGPESTEEQLFGPSLQAKRYCIGSACAAWRFAYYRTEHGILMNRYFATGEHWICEDCDGTGSDANGECCPECEGQGKGVERQAVGFCGLAGRPTDVEVGP